jgi:acyl-CoA synthetase (AMP-forming)/AMP-acid ligase II
VQVQEGSGGHEKSSLGSRIRSVLSLEPDAVAIEGAGGKSTWADLASAAARIDDALRDAQVERDAPIGWVAHNRSAAVAAFVTLAMTEHPIVPLRPPQASATLPVEITAQRLQAVIADESDWARQEVRDAAAAAGSMGIAVAGWSPITVRPVTGCARVGPGPHRPPMPGVVLERLTSGTTGPPKRIPVNEDVLIPSLKSGEQTSSDDGKELRLKRSPAILLKPFSHAGGLFGLLLALYQARPMVLLEKFAAEEWANAIRRYQPRSASLVPAMIRMILDADIAPDALRSLHAIRAGTAPLDPQTQVEFETRFGIPILIDYGAAEFIGGVAGWTLDDHRRFGPSKRGSVGRARPDVQLQVVSEQTGEELPLGRIGVLRVKSVRFGPDYFRTNDLARIDDDGFLFLHGRADDAINRGGFKVLPEEVAAVLRRYTGVRDVAVIGMVDARLGEVPIAAVEMMPGTSPPDPHDLDAFARAHLTGYMVPKEYRFVEALPRTPSMKVSRPELKAMLGI